MKQKPIIVKSITAIMLALSVLLSFPAVQSYAATDSLGVTVNNDIYSKTTAETYLRKKPSTKSKSLLKVKKGAVVTVKSFSGKWYFVHLKSGGKDYKGYLHLNKLAHSYNYLLDSTSLSLTSGKNHTLKIRNMNGYEVYSDMNWTSSDVTVAKVSDKGVISPVGIGKAKIYATKGGRTNVCSVTVNQESPDIYYTYTVNKKTGLYREAKKKKKLATVPKNTLVTYKSKRGKWSKVVYTDSKKKSHTGYIWSANITKKKNYKHTLTKKITIQEPPDTIYQGHNVSLIARLTPLNATEKIHWKSSNTNAVKVDKNGVISYVNSGNATITATSGSASAKVEITSRRKGIAVRHNNIPLRVNATYVTARNLVYSMVSSVGAVYTSSKPEIAEVKNGVITGKSVGTSLITVKAGGYSAAFYVYVHPVSQNAAAPINTMYYTDTDYDTEAYDPEYIPIEEYVMNYAHGSDGAYHPECLYFKNGFAGFKYWLTYTPYPYYNDGYENPCILVSNDLKNWEIPENGKNPIEARPTDYIKGKIYNSDTDLVYNSSTKELECWWRHYDKPANVISIYRRRTKDGVNWTNKELMTKTVLRKADLLSPAVIFENGVYKVWAIDNHNDYAVVYQEYNPKTKKWSKQRIIDIDYTEPDMVNWHIGVLRTPKGYEMVLSAFKKDATNHLTMNVYYSYSKNNIDYTPADVMLEPSRETDNWDNLGIYRSSMMYAEGKYYLFYPGINEEKGPLGIGIISGEGAYYLK